MKALKISVLLLLILLQGAHTAIAAKSIVIPAADYFYSDFTSPNSEKYVRSTGCLGCIPEGAKWESVNGLVKYHFTVPQAGWYNIGFNPEKGTAQDWYKLQIDNTPPFYIFNNTCTYFIDAGKHVLTLEANFWIGFKGIQDIVLKPSNGSLMQSIRIEKDYSDVVQSGKSVSFDIAYAPQVSGKKVYIDAKNKDNGNTYRSSVTLPVSKKNSSSTVGSVRLETPGEYQIFLHDGRIKSPETASFSVFAISTGEPKPTLTKGKLLQEIDCPASPPPYYGGGKPQVITNESGAYVESETKGFRTRGNQNEKDVSWFAYKLAIPQPDAPYLIEVDYPDNTLREFGIGIVPNNGLFSPMIGVETGGEFVPSMKTQTASLVCWPTKSDLRVVILNAHDGMRAAVTKIKIYSMAANGPTPHFTKNMRQYAHWYEENLTFINLVGMDKNQKVAGYEEACARWAQLMASYGENTMIMPVNAYGSRMYPSTYEVDATPAQTDIAKILMLEAERWNMQFIAEFHPMASMLLHWSPIPADKNLYVSKDGQAHVKRSPFIARYNMLYPENQKWLIGLIGDFTDRYKDFSSLEGVSLRFMEWQNSGLYNFHNLDWGYDDYTMAAFTKETEVALPEYEGNERFAKRYAWINSNAFAEWKDWRARKVADLIKRIRDRVVQSRPDLKVYIHETALETKPEGGRRLPRYGRGLSMKYLDDLENVVVINGRYRHGRKMSDFHVWAREYLWQIIRDEMLQPEKMTTFLGSGKGHFLFSHEYLEADTKVVPMKDLGYPSDAKKSMWSIAAEPAGRSVLERYALAMAETDAVFLGDGGNNFSFGPDIVTQEFLPEYYALPRVDFTLLEGAADPVSVREYAGKDAYYFYIVNRDNYPCETQVYFTTAGEVKALRSGKSVLQGGADMQLTLKPFELRAFKTTNPQMHIMNAFASPPKEIQEQRRKMLQELRDLALGISDNPEERKTVAAAVDKATAAADAGQWWKCRVIMDNAELVRIYEKYKKYPTVLRTE